MSKLKTGREEIIYLLTKAVEQYKNETGEEIILNTNRKNYESLALRLSNISNQLPEKSEEFGAESYAPDLKKDAEYPYRKYDITGGQIKDALSGIVSNPRPFLVDACYIYVYGKGRKYFESHPVPDEQLLEKDMTATQQEQALQQQEAVRLQQEIHVLTQKQAAQEHRNRKNRILLILAVIAAVALGGLLLYNSRRWNELRTDMSLLPYQPSAAEVDSLQGIWLCYTGSPQARTSDPDRYHKIVSNLLEVKYKNGYFTFDRFGASFDHTGYMQFESPGLVSIYSRVKKTSGIVESPRHSLLNLNADKNYSSAISASWNFDIGDKNKIIGIREVFVKVGSGGTIEEVMNDLENASCQCKIIRWHNEKGEVKTFYLKNQLLDSTSFSLPAIKPLIDERSILPLEPGSQLVISKASGQDTVQVK